MIEYRDESAVEQKIIDESKNIFLQQGFHFILWGFLIVIGTIITYIFVFTGYFEYINVMWIVLYISGMICSFLFGWRRYMKHNVKSFVGRIYSAIWLGVSMEIGVLFALFNFAGAFSIVVFHAFMCALLGIGFFASGLISRFTWMIMLSVGWLIGSIAIVFAGEKWSTGILGITVLLFLLIPGIVYRLKASVR
jgi:hypothetical protein